MIRQRVSTLITTISLLLSLTAVVALPAVTLAALPNVLVGYGTNSDASPAATSGANPAAVRPSQPVQIQVWAKNGDSSTISQFYLMVNTSGTLQSATWNLSSGGQTKTCVPTSTVTCSFGQIRPGVTVYVSALFTAPATTTVEATMTNEFVFSTTGTAPDGGNNSHGDTFPISQNVRVSSSDDFDGRYLLSNAGTVVQNLQTLSIDNQQATTVYSPATGIGVSVEDGPGLSGGCGEGATCFSETSEINVGNGSSQYGAFKVVVNVHSSNIPSGVNANNITVYHDGVAIDDVCGKNPVAECYSVKKFSWGLQVTIWLLHNGKLNIG
jgi:hypothetical protein